MKRLLIIAFLMSSCGSAQLTDNGLPFPVSATQELHDVTVAAIDGLNNALGYVFEIGEGGIEVLCDNEKKLVNGDRVGIAWRGKVFLDCNSDLTEEYRTLIIAHELFHCIGFHDHYDNPQCLNYEQSPHEGTVESYICDEMKQDFYELYSI